MKTQLSTSFLSTEVGREADAILRRCVHCGFCNATCPTYQLTGDELDGPRGRIYLIKQLLEGCDNGRIEGEATRLHMDRCLTCRNCETTCPSGVEYGRLLDIGREQIEQKISRSWHDDLFRWGLSAFLSRPSRFKLVLNVASVFRGLLPASLRKALPSEVTQDTRWPEMSHSRRVILLQGCVQKIIDPEINAAAARVLDLCSISVVRVDGEACCGALDQHLTKTEKAKQFMRRNIDAWWPYVEEGVEAIVSTASACGVQIKDYGYYLSNDVRYAKKARRISTLAKDISEVLDQEKTYTGTSPNKGEATDVTRVAFHAPCTLQHGQKLGGLVEDILNRWGFETLPVTDGHLCCGSAGTYSILNPELAEPLLANKLSNLQAQQPDVIASANIGCLQHLKKGSGVPVRHWIELLADCQPPK